MNSNRIRVKKSIKKINIYLLFNFKHQYICIVNITPKKHMKTLSQILVIAGLATMVACGPNAEQLAEQARLDSIRISDSIALVEAEQVRIQDSINAAMAADTTNIEVVVE